MIQKNIIQTYELEYKNLPQEALVNIKRWKELNPEWNYMYFSNIDRENFIKFNFDYKWFKIYKDLPLGIMKANLFKYLSLYIYGGIYADLDLYQNKPIDSWLPKNKNFIISADETEDEFIFSIAVIASSKKNKIMESVINYFEKNIKFIDVKNIDRYSVLKYTGELVFLNGIKSFIDPENKILPSEKSEIYNNLDFSKKIGFHSFGAKDWELFRGDAMTNLDAANNWNNGYKNWWQEADSYSQ